MDRNGNLFARKDDAIILKEKRFYFFSEQEATAKIAAMANVSFEKSNLIHEFGSESHTLSELNRKWASFNNCYTVLNCTTSPKKKGALRRAVFPPSELSAFMEVEKSPENH